MYGHISLKSLKFPLDLYSICMNSMFPVSMERAHIALSTSAPFSLWNSKPSSTFTDNLSFSWNLDLAKEYYNLLQFLPYKQEWYTLCGSFTQWQRMWAQSDKKIKALWYFIRRCFCRKKDSRDMFLGKKQIWFTSFGHHRQEKGKGTKEKWELAKWRRQRGTWKERKAELWIGVRWWDLPVVVRWQISR